MKILKILGKAVREKKETLSVEDVLIDKAWEDSKIVIVKLSKDGKKARYVFLKVKGNPVTSPTSIHDGTVKGILSVYKHVKDK